MALSENILVFLDTYCHKWCPLGGSNPCFQVEKLFRVFASVQCRIKNPLEILIVCS